MLNKHHLFDGNKDVVCTQCVNFHIRKGSLHMTVVMRSSDFILGYAYDLPMFSMLHQIVSAKLNVPVGMYTHMSMSLHVYERHFNMLEDIAENKGHYHIDIPKVDTTAKYGTKEFNESNFGRWINEL